MPSNSRSRNNKSKSQSVKKGKKKSSTTRSNTKSNTRSNTRKKSEVPKAMRQENIDKKYKPVTNKKSKKPRKKHPKLMITLKILIIIILLIAVIAAGIIVGMFFGLFGDQFEISKDDLRVATANSVIVNQSGEVIANLSGDEKRKVITLDEMADYLPKAYVAIEDERFYSHNGVDLKRTAGAILTTLIGKNTYGGSTITQQLVKNITKDKESSGMAGIFRKVKEWTKAYQVERMISKQQILELYLNILFVGSSNLHGVELGAEYYFNKSAKDLDLAECAFMAGINSSPVSYDPYDEEKDNTEKIKNKTKVVLDKMKELGYIENEEDYTTAVAKVEEGLKFEKGQIASSASNYSYHTDAILDQVITQVMEEKDISRELATNYVYSSGLTIYSTVDNDIQTRLEQEYLKDKYIKKGRDKKDGELVNDHTQSGMAIIDYKTGYVLGVAGGLGEKDVSGWNRATQMKKQTGSSIKIVADVAPALEEKVITPSTAYIDEETDFGGNYKPKNDNNAYKHDSMNIREFIRLSRNIPAVKIMKELTPKKAIEYLQKMGFSSIDKDEDNVPALAIGGMTNGASPLEMAAAYGTIANDGVYITPTFYTKIVDASGKVVMTPNQQHTKVFSEQTAYLTKSIAQEPVKSGGTATYCAIPGMDVAAKTGTTDNSYDRWLCGFTPYYAAACWFGFDNNEEVRDFVQNPAGSIWDAVMTDIHSNLPGETFKKPSGIVEETVCSVTGGLATSKCGNTYKEIFASNNLPDKCEGHGSQTICVETGKEATPYCSQYGEVKQNYYGVGLPKERLNLWTSLTGRNKTAGTRVNSVCDVHTKPKEATPKPSPSTIPKPPSASASPSPSPSASPKPSPSAGATPKPSATPSPKPPAQTPANN